MKKTFTLIILAFFILFGNLCFAAEGLRIDFLDVGEGDAIFIQTPKGNAMIDCAGLLFGYRVTGYLQEKNITRLDYLIISHPHPDHMGGVFFLVPKFSIGEIFDNGQKLDTREDIYRWYGNLIHSKDNYRVLKAGDSLRMDTVTMEVLSPDSANQFTSFNANSLVIRLTYGNFRCLLVGDFNKIGEKVLLEKKLDLTAQVLKVGHHGYFDATSAEFLRRVSPQYAVISVAKDNQRGAPSPQTLELLQSRKVKVLRTDINGDISIVVDEKGKVAVTTQQ